MKVLILLLLAGLVLGSQSNTIYSLDQAEEYFEQFIKKYDKHYSGEAEKQKRFEIFKENLKVINEKNARGEAGGLGITMFSDLTTEEFIDNYTGLRSDMNRQSSECDPGSAASTDAPDSFDWRDQGVISTPKNQGGCGSCWAFSAIGNIEAHYAMMHSDLLDLAEQQLVDCDQRSSGCKGTANLEYPFLYLIQSGGSLADQDYLYEEQQGECKFDRSKVKVTVTGCVTYNPESEEELKNILYKAGPLTISVDSSDIRHYKGSILQQCSMTSLNHAVLLVGYGTENDTPYWVIKNSWGEEFGEGGFVKVRRGVNACGMMDSFMVQGVVA